MMDSSSPPSFFVTWPSAPLTDYLVRKALLSLPAIKSGSIHPTLPQSHTYRKLIQWSTYDAIDHVLTHTDRDDVLSSSYIIRKALIRKHFLSRCIHSYLTKHPYSVLRASVPKTWDIEISFADELDELWADELWDLSEVLDRDEHASEPVGTDIGKWWILKPGMADRGMGIRLFNSKESLRRTLEEFDDESESATGGGKSEEGNDDNDDGHGAAATTAAGDASIAISQLRHFVIQEYLSRPLLLDPREARVGRVSLRPTDQPLEGHKFHLRVYCVASGDLTLYSYVRALALFSSKPYTSPVHAADGAVDLVPHLTNSSLQTHKGEEGVRLFDELLGCHILSGEESDVPGGGSTLTVDHLENIQDQIADVLAETFKAALQSPIHFQPLANAFELYGVDFLIEHITSPQPQFQVKLLEMNAEPAVELTGPRLTWVLEDLFNAIAHVCVGPFVRDVPVEAWPVGETRHHLRKCLETKVRGG